MGNIRNFFIAMTRNPISLLGAAIVTASGILIVTLFSIELFGFLGNPYIGILAYLVLPAIFLVGLLLIPVGIIRERRGVTRGSAPLRFPVIDLNTDRTRRLVLIFIVLTAVNLVILATATFKGVEVMESVEFCGTTCHSVMAPEHTAYERSPHSRVRCVDCHIGPGADWFVKSKLSGAWQVISTTFELYPKPIPTPVHDLRPARETCEQCHWPDKFIGDRLSVRTHFSNDEENSELKTVLVMHVGGQNGGVSNGIHWHVDPDNRIRYRSDPTRETIYEVELTKADGTVKTYLPADGVVDPGAEWRVMDCVDCHNRPSHVYRSPEHEIDLALEVGSISRELPFVRREGLKLLRADYASHDEARAGIDSGLRAFYSADYPDLMSAQNDEIDRAVEMLAVAHSSNVFPAMAVTWGTYPNHIGHEQSPGCFRCHNDEHTTADGETIEQDCYACHAMLAVEEEDPEILSELFP